MVQRLCQAASQPILLPSGRPSTDAWLPARVPPVRSVRADPGLASWIGVTAAFRGRTERAAAGWARVGRAARRGGVALTEPG